MNEIIYEIVSPYSQEVAALWAGFLVFDWMNGQLAITPLGLAFVEQLEKRRDAE